MYLAKKILLSLIFSSTFTGVIYYLVMGILNTNYYLDINRDPEIIISQLEVIMDWVCFGLLVLASVSSFVWLMNFGSAFKWWKIPALLILPFSIPFLIIDYLESTNPSKKITPIAENSDQKKQNNQLPASLIIMLIVVGLNILIVILQLSWILPIVPMFGGWYYLLTGIPVAILLGTLFLVLNYYYPNKILFWLSFLGLTANWVSLFLNIIDKKQINYFFKPTKIPATY